MTRITGLLSLFALMGLSACGNEQSGLAGSYLSGLQSLVSSAAARNAPSLRERLTPEVLLSIDGSVLLVELPDIEAEAGAQPVRTGGDHVIWSTLNQVHFMFRDGVLSATRGLAGDLMSADLSQVNAAVRGRRSSAVRVHYYLNGEDEEFTRAFQCTYQRSGGQTIGTILRSYRTTLVSETCYSSGDTIENQYWIDGSGTVRKSKQWVGKHIGYVFTERAKD